MSDPAVAALGDQKLDEVDLTVKDPLEGEVLKAEVNDTGDKAVVEQGKADDIDTADLSDPVHRGEEKDTAPVTQPSPLLQPQNLSSHPADDLHRPDSPTTDLIASLRSQLSLLSEQSHQLNTKLVASISRHADLEDQHFALTRERDDLHSKNAELTKVKETWEESMKTGLYVEQAQIKDEMQRLAAGLVEEERKRGSAEQRRQAVENEVDELAASLFDQANTMVAQERMGRLEAESRLKSTEENLAAAEAAVRDMQLHLQSLPNTAAPNSSSSVPPALTRRYLSSHVPYIEFISFVQHIRSLRPLRDTSKITFPSPLITNLLTQPFLTRTVAEDHDATLRLDVAPDLSWLSRRGVSSAIVGGELVIEPISASSLLATTTTPAADIGCSLCGKPVFPQMIPQSPAVSHFGPPPSHPTQRNSASRFSLKPFFNSTSTTSSPAPASAPTSSSSPLPSPLASPNPANVPSTPRSSSSLPSVYIFRIAKSTTNAPTTEKAQESQNKSYPLCRSGWCLERLRATCELWHFVRTGIVQVIWAGDDGYLLQSEIAQPAEGEKGEVIDLTEEKPPLPPRKRSGWGLGFKTASTSAAASGSGTSWTKGWGSRSGTASPPPQSPLNGEKRSSISGGSIGAEKGSDDIVPDPDTEGGLGEPLELRSEQTDVKGKGKEKEVVPVIQETESSPSTTTRVPDAPMPTSDAVEGLLQPEPDQPARVSSDLKRAESAISLNSTNRSENEKFATPQSEHADLLDAEGEKLRPMTTNEQDQNQSPVIGPPPIPKRAAGRTKPNGESSSGEASPGVVEVTEDKPESSGQEAESKEQEQGEEVPPTPRPAPPLPPRHPRTPKQENRESRVEEKTFLRQVDQEEEEWESKTWKMVVKLKEQMWKTRVGVVDTDVDE